MTNKVLAPISDRDTEERALMKNAKRDVSKDTNVMGADNNEGQFLPETLDRVATQRLAAIRTEIT